MIRRLLLLIALLVPAMVPAVVYGQNAALPPTGQRVEGRFRTVDTIADLANLNAANQATTQDGEKVWVMRYSTSHTYGDGSGQMLRYSTTAGGTVDNGFIFAAPAGGNTRFIAVDQTVINAKRFGAVGNGVADDTTRLQACIDLASSMGVPVYVPTGTYLVAKTANPWCLQLKSGLHLHGAGIGKSIIKLVNGQTSDNTRIFSNSVAVSNVRFKDVTIDGNKANYSGTVTNDQNHGLITVPGSTNLQFVECEFKDCKGDGLYIQSAGNTVRGCKFSGNYRIGLHISKCSETQVTNNTFDDTSIAVKVELDPGDVDIIMKNLQITNNNIRSLEGILLNVAGQSGSEFRNLVVSDNVIEILTHLYAAADYFQTPTSGVDRGKGAAGNGIYISGVRNATISNNQIFNGCDRAPIQLAYDCQDVVVSGNTIKNQTQSTGQETFMSAIALGLSSIAGQNRDITISNNTIENTLGGILVTTPTGGTDTTRLLVSNNRIVDLGTNTHALDLHNLSESQIIGNFVDLQQTTTCVRLRSTLTPPTNIDFIGNTFKTDGTGGVFWFEGENGNATNVRVIGNKNLSTSAPWLFNTQPGGLLFAAENVPRYPVPFVVLESTATPSVASLSNVTTGGTTPITNFSNGVDGQSITVEILATHQVNNGVNIATTSGGNLSGPTVRTFTLDGAVWREIGDGAGGGDNLGAGSTATHRAGTDLDMNNFSIINLELGAAGTPSLSFNSDSNTGLYSPNADEVALTAAGVQSIRSTAVKNFLQNAVVLEFYDDLEPDGANQIDVQDKTYIRIDSDNGPHTISYFTNGVEGQLLYVVMNGGDTINDGTSFIELDGNTNFTATNTSLITFIMRSTIWYEQSRREF
jgi:parallel beta-helix repeat protein